MCGISGILHRNADRPVDRKILQNMNDIIAHRGPDDEGFYFGAGVGLGHRRLSIIDLGGGHQPMFNGDGSVVIVFNGEIFNFHDLTKVLSAAGYQFKTKSDTEVIIHAWEEWGEDCVSHLRGQFAFAIWDENKHKLFLARDRLGIKSLFYAELADGSVIFGSELKAVMQHPDLSREMSLSATEDYFAYGYVPDPKTIFTNVSKLEPGHAVSIDQDGGPLRPMAYWNVDISEGDGRSEKELGEELIERLKEAVKIRMIADVPLGAFLSGGVDSSAIVALMSELSDEPVDTCSIAFGSKSFDESPYAQKIADRYETRHETRTVDPSSLDLIDKLVDMYDEPYADSSAMPTYRVCALAREKVTVALSGDGGDELYAGYRRYKFHHYEEQTRSKIPAGLRGPLFGTLGRLYPKMDWAPRALRAKSTLQAIAKSSIEGYFDSLSVANDEVRYGFYSDTMKSDLQGYSAREVLERHFADAPTDHPVSKAQYVDLKTYLAGDILTKVDRASMAVSLEVRVPILDHEFVEWSMGVDPALKLNNGEGKYLLKKALEPYVPHDLLYRPKMGFSMPIGEWFRGPLKKRLRDGVCGQRMGDTGMFDMAALEHMVDQHISGRRSHDAVLWSLMMFDGFLASL